MNEFKDLSIVIPAYNEERGIEAVLIQLRNSLPGAEVIVVDDASSDGTAQSALQQASDDFDLIVLQHSCNHGYGSSLSTGMGAATREYVAWFDADNEHCVDDLKAMVARLRNEHLVAVIGQRSESVSRFRALGKGLIKLLARAFNVSAGGDLNCGLRVFRREVIINYTALLPARYSASLTTTILMIERGYPIAFHPVRTALRMGTSKLRLRDGFIAMAKVLNLITLFAPMRIFFRGGALLIAVGVIYGAARALMQPFGFPVAGLLLIVVGFLLAVLGLIAEQISQMRLGALSGQRRVRHLNPLSASQGKPHADEYDTSKHLVAHLRQAETRKA